MADESFMHACVKILIGGLGVYNRVRNKCLLVPRTDKMKKAEVLTKIEREVAISDQSMRGAKLMVSPIVTLLSKFESITYIQRVRSSSVA